MNKVSCPHIDKKELERVLKVLGNGTIPGEAMCIPGEAMCIPDGGKRKIYGGGGWIIALVWLVGLLTAVNPDTGGEMLGALAYGGCNAFTSIGTVTHNPSLKTLDEPGTPIKPKIPMCIMIGELVKSIASKALTLNRYREDLLTFADLLKQTKNNSSTITNQTTAKEIIDEVEKEVPPPETFSASPQPNRINNRTKNEAPPPPPSSDEYSSHNLHAPARGPENNELGPTPGNVYPIGYVDAILAALSVALLRRGISIRSISRRSNSKSRSTSNNSNSNNNNAKSNLKFKKPKLGPKFNNSINKTREKFHLPKINTNISQLTAPTFNKFNSTSWNPFTTYTNTMAKRNEAQQRAIVDNGRVNMRGGKSLRKSGLRTRKRNQKKHHTRSKRV